MRNMDVLPDWRCLEKYLQRTWRRTGDTRLRIRGFNGGTGGFTIVCPLPSRESTNVPGRFPLWGRPLNMFRFR